MAAFNLSQRMGASGRFKDDSGTGFRSNPDFSSSVSNDDGGGTGNDQNNSGVSSSNIPGQPHSSAGFRRALEHTQRKSNRVIGGISKQDASMGSNRKPNYFGQGGRRHGMHIGAGSPATIPAQNEGMDFGE